MQEHKRLAKNTLLFGLSRGGALLSFFVLTPVMTERLSNDDYGILDLIISYVELIIPFLLLAMQQGTWRFLLDARDAEEDKKRIISTAIFTFLPVLIVTSGLYAVIALIFRFNLAFEIFVFIIIASINNYTSFILRGFGENCKFAISSLIAILFNVIFICIALLLFQSGVKGVLLAYAASGSIAVAFNIISTRIYKYVKVSHVNKETRKEMLAFSLPNIPNSLTTWILSASNRTIVSLVLGLAANGIFAVSNKFASILIMISNIFGMAWVESAVLNFHKEPATRDNFFTDIFNKEVAVFGSIASLLLPATAIGFPIMVDSKFSEGYLFVPLMIFGGLIGVFNYYYAGIYIAKKLAKKSMILSFFTAIINLAVLFSLIWFIGLWAAPVATAVAYLALAVYCFFDVKKYLSITYNKKLFLCTLLMFSLSTFLYFCEYWLPETFFATTLVTGHRLGAFGVHMLNMMITTVFAIVLNKSLVKGFLGLVLSKCRRRI